MASLRAPGVPSERIDDYLNLYDTLAGGFRPQAERTAIITSAESWTYAAIESRTAQICAYLASVGVRAGDRVAMHVDKSAEGLAAYLGCIRFGAVFLPLNPAYRADEVAYFLDDAEPSVAIGRPQDAGWFVAIARRAGVGTVHDLDAAGHGSWTAAIDEQPSADPAADRTSADDLAAIVYTSGTTGRSKGAMITHRNLVSNALTLQRAWGFVDSDVLLHALPIFHVHGLFVATHTAMLTGVPMIFHQSFEAARVLQALPDATVFMGVPTMYTRLLSQPGLNKSACRSMRLFISGSAPLLAETFSAFQQRTGHTVLERYGMTETSMNTSNPYVGERRGGTVGFPLDGVGVRVVDEHDRPLGPGSVGEVQVKGPNVLRGYWRRPDKDAEEFTADGWFRTGDIGVFDADGYLELVGRSKDLVISGGYNVYPKEIELLIDQLPGVVESAVIGVPHADFGEAVTAVVITEPGVVVDEVEWIAILRSRLAPFKVPKQIHVVDELPRNAMGKVQKNLLRSRFSAGGGAGETSVVDGVGRRLRAVGDGELGEEQS